jgi:16S rRNA (cytosine1402-N4)-methyltransferase
VPNNESIQTGDTGQTEPLAFHHVPVLFHEVIEWLQRVPAGLYVDYTTGGAGHAQGILDAHPHLAMLGLDRDPVAVEVARERLRAYGQRARVVHARSDDLAAVLREDPRVSEGMPVTAILADLGVSSVQFDQGDRGFSYRHDAPLDMRMDTSRGRTASDLVNESSFQELADAIRIYGDEKFAGRIAKAIIANRPITGTTQLSEIVTTAIPAATRRTGGHPAKRTFQALRIVVNEELDLLRPSLEAGLDALAPGGRFVVLAYHSGEDRIVKDVFRTAETGGCSCPSGLPCVCGALPRGRMVHRGVTRPQAAEIAANPRAASAVARIFETVPGAAAPGMPSTPARPLDPRDPATTASPTTTSSPR